MNYDNKSCAQRRGFTLIELVIVIAVIAVLAAVLIPAFSGIIQKAKYNAALQEARGALTAFAVNTAAQTGAGGCDVYLVTGFEDSPFYFTCESGELKDAPEGSLNRSLEDGEIIRVAVDDSYLIEGETGLEMSDALSSALAEIFGQEPLIDKYVISFGGKQLVVDTQQNLGDTMMFVMKSSSETNDSPSSFWIRYPNDKYVLHGENYDTDNVPKGAENRIVIQKYDDSKFPPMIDYSSYFKLYDENWNPIDIAKYSAVPEHASTDNRIVYLTIFSVDCNIWIATDEDLPDPGSNDPPESSSGESVEGSEEELYFGIFAPESIRDYICIIDNNSNTVITDISTELGLRGMSIRIELPNGYKAIMGNETYYGFKDGDFFYIIIEEVTDNIYISEIE